jgi:hypothetical protein
MREPIIERLSRFTPDGSGLDRDAILFAAGRASVRPNRAWILATGALAACQLVTLSLLWPRPMNPLSPPVEPIVATQLLVASGPASTNGTELALLTRQFLQSGKEDFPSPPVAGPMVPSDPPLYAYVGSIPADLK